MQLIDAIILAVVQGATEFLPVSSSGHVALCGKLLGMEQAPLDFVVAIHLGTLIAVVVYYRRDLAAIVRSILGFGRWTDGGESRLQYRRLFIFLVVGTIPAAIAGYLLEDAVDAAFSDVRLIGAALVGTAALLVFSAGRKGQKELNGTTLRDAVLVGFCQAMALVPGLSRSGCTIAGGLFSGFSREWAPRFAFLLSVPVILGGAAVSVLRIIQHPAESMFDPFVYGLSVFVAAIVGYSSVLLVIDSVKRGNLLYYALYCLVLGMIAIVVGFLTPS